MLVLRTLQACPKNEIHEDCPSYCDNVPCSWIGKKKCDPNGPDKCIPACVCKDGLCRNAKGQCVRKKTCLKCNKPNEYLELDGCDRTCAGLTKPCVTVKNKCVCEPVYARNKFGICMRNSHCNTPKCKKYEEWTECVNVCPITCDGLDSKKPCSGSCKPGCDCIKGTVRDENDNCIPPEQCPAACSDEDSDED